LPSSFRQRQEAGEIVDRTPETESEDDTRPIMETIEASADPAWWHIIIIIITAITMMRESLQT